MMFLQFFIWGGWFVTLGTYLASTLEASGGQIAMAFSTQSWGAIIAPLIIGLIADKYFNDPPLSVFNIDRDNVVGIEGNIKVGIRGRLY